MRFTFLNIHAIFLTQLFWGPFKVKTIAHDKNFADLSKKKLFNSLARERNSPSFSI